MTSRCSSWHRRVLHAGAALGLALAALLAACGGSGSEPSEPGADLVATLSGPGGVTTATDVSYTVTVTNNGPAEARDVVASLDILPGMTPVAGSPVTVTAGRATWPPQATLAGGTSQDFTVTLTAAAAGAGTLIARASSGTRDPVAGNNDGTAAGARLAVTVTAPPTATDLRISLGGGLSGANLAAVGVSLNVLNNGPITATNVVVELVLPDDVSAANFSPAGGVRANGRITWALGDVTAGALIPVTLDLTVPLRSATPLTATAVSSTDDSNPANNAVAGTLRAVVAPVYTLNGQAAGDTYGWVTENVGDLDGDGKNDFALSAILNDAGGADAGRAYLYSGGTGTLLFTVTGDVANGQLGFSMDVVGDLNGDAVPDLVFGAPGAGVTPGYARAVSGANGSTLWRFATAANGDFTGYGVGRAGDLNGDGIPDVLVGSPGRSPNGLNAAGTVWVVSGATGSAIDSVHGTVAGGTLGTAARSVGDVNNDGVPDFAAGSVNEGGGRIRVFSGADGTLVYPALSAPNGGSLGQFWVNSPGDIDGDGVPDIFAIDINNATGGANRGQAYVFSGATGARIRTFSGESAGDQFGIGRGVGDITGDGVPDFALAAWRRSEGATNSGKMYLVDGVTGATLRSMVSIIPGETLGYDLIGLGDVTGDGLVDYLVTAGQETGPGKAYVIAGVALE